VLGIGLVMVDSLQDGNDDAVQRWLAQARVAIERERWPLAEDRLRRVHASRPADLEVARLLAQVVRERDGAEEAELILRTAWQVGAGEAPWEPRRELLLELADLRLAIGRPAEAARALQRVLEVEENHWEALALLGSAFLDGGHVPEAVRAYRESVSANPLEAETRWNLATAHERAGDPAAAAEALDGWLRLSGDSPERERVERDIARLRGRR
jgi:Flp pilus assembly protein TadD